MTNPHRRLLLTVLSALAVFGVGEAVMRALVAHETPFRRVLDDQERRDASWYFGGAQRRRGIALAGTSLAAGKETSISRELRARLPIDTHLVDDSHPGLVADIVARSIENHERGLVTVAELNVFPFNERRYLFADWRKYSVVARPAHLLDVLQLPDPGVHWAGFEQGGFDGFAGAGLRRVASSYFFGQAIQGGVRERLRFALLGRGTPPNRPSQTERDNLTRQNITRKSFDAGIDTQVLRATATRACKDRAGSSLIVYFPPLALGYLRDLGGGETSFLARFSAWRAEVTASFGSCGVAVLDYTELFVDRPDYFLDYGHMEDAAFPVLSERMAGDLRELRLVE